MIRKSIHALYFFIPAMASGVIIFCHTLCATGSCEMAAGHENIDKRSSIEVIYVIEFTHADVGFNAPPSVMQQRNHDRTVAALDIADSHPDFHWTIETLYQLECFLDRASPSDGRRLRTRLEEGRFAVGANYLNLHSGICSEEQFHRQLYPAARFAHTLEYLPATAMLNDVPGFSVATPRVLAGGGVPYAILGANDFIGGKPDIPLQDRPFWWEARDGSRVLSWLTYGSYIEGFFEWGLVNISNMLTKIPARIQEFEEAGYPFDAVLVARASDDQFPSTAMLTLAHDWNLHYAPPRIELATARNFFEYLQNTYGDSFQVYHGDASCHWEDVCTVTPASHARVRRARSSLAELEALWSLMTASRGLSYPIDRFNKAWNLSMILDEHSSGGYGWPGLLSEEEIRQENEEFVAVALSCERITKSLQRQGVAMAASKLVPEGEAGLVLLNPLGDAYEGIVEVDCGAPQAPDLCLADPAGGPDATFRWTNEDRSALAAHVSLPARGWRRWTVTGGGSTSPPPSWTEGCSIEIGDHRLTLDNSEGTASNLLQLSTFFDWLEQPGPHRFGGIEFAPHLDEFFGQWSHSNPVPGSILAEEPAPLFRRLRVFDMNDLLIREYCLFEEERRLDVGLVVRTSLLPEVPYDDHSHHYSVSFPANLDTSTVLTIDGPDGWYRPGIESLPGAALGHFASSTGARLEGASGRWLSVTSPDTPILNLGEMEGWALPQVEEDELALTWKLCRHADSSLVKGGALVPMEAEPGMPDSTLYTFCVRFGDTDDIPPDRETLRSDMAPPFSAWIEQGQAEYATPAQMSLIDMEGSAELICLKRSEADDGVILRLRAEDDGVSVIITPFFEPTSAWITDLIENPTQELPVVGGSVSVPLVPHGVITVLLRD